MGSPTALLRSDGSLATRYAWGVWGERRGGSGASSSELGFTGYLTDAATGFCYAKARFYDPEVGRFLSEDPLEGDALTPPSLHRYVYAFDNPAIYVDRDGRCVGDYADSEPCLALKRAAEAAWEWFKAPFDSAAENATAAVDEGIDALAAVEGGLRADRYSAADVEEYIEQGNGGSASAPALRKLATAGERIGAAAEHAGQAALDAYSAAERAQLVAGTAYLAWEGGRFVVKQGVRRLSGSADDIARTAESTILDTTPNGILTESTVGIGPEVSAPRSSPGLVQRSRPSWRESESEATAQLTESGFSDQVSFREGGRVPRGTPGSTRPDNYSRLLSFSVDVKNYNVETAAGRSSLVTNVVNQAIERAKHLPLGTQQGVMIDVRGQSLSQETIDQLRARIVTRSGGLLKGDNVVLLIQD